MKVRNGYTQAQVALKILEDWIATNAVIGQQKKLGDFTVSNIPRPDVLKGPLGRMQRAADEWKSRLHKCIGQMATVNLHQASIDYAMAAVSARLWVDCPWHPGLVTSNSVATSEATGILDIEETP